jgi:hypothetical protein
VIRGIGLEVADGCKEYLVPAAQENAAAILQILQPGLLVFDVEAECPAIGTDEVIKRALYLANQQIPIFVQQQHLLLMQI